MIALHDPIDDVGQAAAQGRYRRKVGYQALGCLPPTYEPRATGRVPEMIEMMRGLIERGHAYESDGNARGQTHPRIRPASARLSATL